MNLPTTTVQVRPTDTLVRILLPGIGAIDIEPGLTDAAGRPVVRVDVLSDAERYGHTAYGLNKDGIPYEVKNGDPGPGVVFLVGNVSRETEPDREAIEREGQYLLEQSRDFDMCDDGCGKHVDHKANGDLECGPR